MRLVVITVYISLYYNISMCVSFLLLYNVDIVELLFSDKFPLCLQYRYRDENVYFRELIEYLKE